MKRKSQAILITAYKNINQLNELIGFFPSDFNIYIHLDKKTAILPEDRSFLKSNKNVRIISQKFNINWGGINHLKAILFLAKCAVNDQDNFYFHLISGQDYPIKDIHTFSNFFSNNSELNYLEYFDVPKASWSGNGGMDRLQYYNFYDLFNYKNPRERWLITKMISWQKRIPFKRKLSKRLPRLYGGSTWWSLSRECLSYVVAYTNKNPLLLKRLKHTFCPEEFYFQTVILNSTFCKKSRNDNLRYIDWSQRNGNRPAVLDRTDFQKVKTSNAFFARKLEYPTSEPLFEKIKNIIYV